MTAYWVDDGGNNTTGASWATAYTSIAALVSAVPTALTTSGNIVYVGDSHIDSVTGANRTYTGPTSGLPVILISADITDNGTPPAYKKGTGAQLKTDDGAFTMALDGSFALYGIRMAIGATSTVMGNDDNEAGFCDDCTFVLPANGQLQLNTTGKVIYRRCTIDLTNDGTTARTANLLRQATGISAEISGLSFVNAGYRTGTVINNGGQVWISGADFSGFTNGTVCEIADLTGPGQLFFTNCLTAATWTPLATVVHSNSAVTFTNCGSADAPTYLFYANFYGTVLSSASIYRTGGAAVEGDPTGWLITTTASCGESAPFYTPWLYGLVSSTGSKTFTVCVTNDTAAFTDAEVWLQVEYMATLDIGTWTAVSDHRATITTTAAAQTTDGTSSWTGTGPAFTYKQSLAATATIGETGQYRARVVVGKASIASSSYFYVDPKVSIT